jgi:hypothetical protein
MYLNQEHCCMDVYVKAFQFFLITSKKRTYHKKNENHTLKKFSQRRIFGSLQNNVEKYCLIMKDLENGFALFLQNADVKMCGNKFDGGASTLYL